MKLIDKDALVVEIDELREYAYEHWDVDEVRGIYKFIDKLESYIDTLEVKEVDLKQLYREYINDEYTQEFAQSILDYNTKGDLDSSDLFGTMSYGFELGLKAQKGEEL